jgi:2-dehydro-3-deoxyglucarate aldolase/4-hydroxy-2-oxoheptanedioate aldolase
MSDPVAVRFRDRLKEGERLLGTLLSLPSPEVAEICAVAGFDWLFIDMEHGLLDFADVQRMIQAAGRCCPCVVRVPSNEAVWVCKALDAGAAGIIFPHVNNAEDARSVVFAAKYPPQGIRSIAVARAQGYGSQLQECVDNANLETVLIAQAEHVEAARNIESILAVPGLDAILVGPYDLSASLEKPGRVTDPEVVQAIDRVRDACAARGMPAGIFARDTGTASRAFSAGFSLVCVATDCLLLLEAARGVVKQGVGPR